MSGLERDQSPVPEFRPSLKGRLVFLSASFPSAERHPRYYETADADELTQAIVSLARATFAVDGRLLFGGHPSVSPLIMMIAEEYLPVDPDQRGEIVQSRGFPVVMYQSAAFDSWISEATRRMQNLGLGEIKRTPIAANEMLIDTSEFDPTQYPESLRLMRDEMIATPDLAGAVYIGGMEGIEKEAQLFREIHSDLPTYFAGAPGGAAREILETSIRHARESSGNDLPWLEEQLTAREYPALMQRIVADMAQRL